MHFVGGGRGVVVRPHPYGTSNNPIEEYFYIKKKVFITQQP